MGVSQWKAIGEKCGYWKFFEDKAKKQEQKRIESEFLSKAKMMTTSLSGGLDEWRITKKDFNEIILSQLTNKDNG